MSLKGEHPFRMAVDPDWEPYEWVADDGQFRGIAADLLELVAMRLGISLELVPTMDWAQSLGASKSGEAHILANKRLADLIGVSPEEVVGRTSWPYSFRPA